MFHFKENGKLDIATEFLFQPPKFEKTVLHHVFNNCNSILEKLKKNALLTEMEQIDLQELPTNYMICILNEIPNAYSKLLETKDYLRNLKDKSTYIKYKEAVRVLRKVNFE